MAHYALLDDNNYVVNVVVIDNNDSPDEATGVAFCQNLFGGGNWKKTSYNTRGNVHSQGGTPFRKNYAGIGYYYDSTLDAFHERQPYPSWILNTSTCLWEAPVPYPSDGNNYIWNEATTSWVLFIYTDGSSNTANSG
jgi:hypothetical protein